MVYAPIGTRLSGQCFTTSSCRYLRNVRVAIVTSIYWGVWDIHSSSESALRDPSSRLCGEVAWVLNVLGFNDRLVDERIDNDKVCQFTGPDFARKVSGQLESQLQSAWYVRVRVTRSAALVDCRRTLHT